MIVDITEQEKNVDQENNTVANIVDLLEGNIIRSNARKKAEKETQERNDQNKRKLDKDNLHRVGNVVNEQFNRQNADKEDCK
eukprot:6262998-Heterocapsa_arctica.AAC.1